MNKSSKFECSALTSGWIGLIAAIGITLLSSLLLPAEILKEVIKYETALILVPIVMFLSSFAGAMVAGKIAKDNGNAAIGIAIGLYILILVCCGFLFFDGMSQKAITGLFAILLGGGASLYLSNIKINQKRRKGRHRKFR